MRLSTRGRYGTRLMFEFALHYGEGHIQLGDAAKRQGISEKYLSKLVLPLKAAGFINSARGFKGGYSLTRKPETITLMEIVEALEGNISPVECVMDEALCDQSDGCPTRFVWCELAETIKESLSGISLKDLVDRFHLKNRELEIDYSI